jgi:branched-chain amino acid transport system permease protein
VTGDPPVAAARMAGALAALVALLLVAPLFADRYVLSVLILVFLSAYLGQAWNILMGFCGLLSLGHALYIGLGAYVSAGLFVRYGIGPLAGAVPAVLVSLLAATLLGWLGFRFRIEGVYFALLTIAFAEIARIAFDNLAITGGAAGLFLPVRAEDAGQWWNLRAGPTFFYYLSFAMAAAAFVASFLLRRSRLGHAWLAMREDPAAARAVGISPFRTRLSALLVSAGLTSLGGVFIAFWSNNLFPAQIFDITRSTDILFAPVIGGVGTLFGPILGAFLLVPLGEVLTALLRILGIDAPGAKALAFGLLLIVIIAASPNGVWPWLARRFFSGKRS